MKKWHIKHLRHWDDRRDQQLDSVLPYKVVGSNFYVYAG